MHLTRCPHEQSLSSGPILGPLCHRSAKLLECQDEPSPPHEHLPRKRTLLSTAVKHERVCYAIGRTSPSASSPSPSAVGLRTGRGARTRLPEGTRIVGGSGFSRPPSCSFDHLVGAGEERGWDREAEGFGGFEV